MPAPNVYDADGCRLQAASLSPSPRKSHTRADIDFDTRVRVANDTFNNSCIPVVQGAFVCMDLELLETFSLCIVFVCR